jgi:hypothetical protein
MTDCTEQPEHSGEPEQTEGHEGMTKEGTAR